MIARHAFAALLAFLFVARLPSVAAGQVAPLRLFGFGDFNYVVTEREVPTGFRTGQLAAHAITGLTPRLTFFGELSATPTATGVSIEVERLILRQDFSDFFKLSAGRYHTPVSYWNTAYHHGQWLQTTVARPEMVRFGGTLLPIHFIGVQVEGSFPRNPLNPGYAVGVGNGRHQSLGRAGDAGDSNGHRALLASGSLRPRTLFGLNVGGSVYLDRIDTPATLSLDERIASVHVAWETSGPELVTEYASIRHSEVTGAGGVATASAAYLQLAYRLPGRVSAWKPYTRIERVEPGRAPLLPQFGELQYESVLTGLRFDFAPMAALKAEHRYESHLGSPRSHSLFFQVSFALGAAEDAHQHHVAAAPAAHRLPGVRVR